MNASRLSLRRLSSRVLTITLLSAAALALAACTSSASYTAHDITGIMPDLNFELTNENGERVDETDYDEARLTLLFFGYTHCPDICPMTLSQLSAAISGLDKQVRDDINVLFVSVDPRRDPPKRLKAYTAHFGPQFIGLTGTQEQLTQLTKAMRVTYGYGEPNAQGFYLVSHSAAVFVFDDQGRVRLLISQDQSVDKITQDLQTLLEQTD